MKVILVNGSPRPNGCTFTGLSIIKEQLTQNGVDSEIFQIGNKPIIGCIACMSCKKTGKCAFDDDLVNTVAEKMKEADGIILGSAVHFAGATGAATSFFDRLFYSADRKYLKLKFGACIVSCRRGGASATFDQLNKYFTIAQMPIVSSCYWNQIHGYTPEDVFADEEGVRTLKVLANNMAYLIKCKYAGNIAIPEEPEKAITNFIR
ncbi:MAG: flavodoxin family protein [Spirochaetaceae bacterium]|jgi:multimeric flavodoxin WrbA|nr:flavodoxin family protein [Spirochaetaceae bacterium]